MTPEAIKIFDCYEALSEHEEVKAHYFNGDSGYRERRPCRFCFRTDKKHYDLLKALSVYYEISINRLIENLIERDALYIMDRETWNIVMKDEQLEGQLEISANHP